MSAATHAAVTGYQPCADAAAEVRSTASAIGGTAMDNAVEFAAAAAAQLSFIETGIAMQRPAPMKLQTLLAPVQQRITALEKGAKDAEATKLFPHHCKLLVDIAQCFTWPTSAAAKQLIADQLTASQMASNKLSAAHKGDEKHAAFAKAVQGFAKALAEYVDTHHAGGFTWGMVAPKPPVVPNHRTAEAGTMDAISQEALNVVTVADKLGNAETIAASKALQACTVELQKLVDFATKNAKPSVTKFNQLMNPLTTALTVVGKHSGGSAGFEHHCKMISDASQGFNWVQQPSKPEKFIQEAMTAATYSSNKVASLARQKDVDPEGLHMLFTKAVSAVLQAMADYVKARHSSGLSWNTAEAVSRVASRRPSDAGGDTSGNLPTSIANAVASSNAGIASSAAAGSEEAYIRACAEAFIGAEKAGEGPMAAALELVGLVEEQRKFIETASHMEKPSQVKIRSMIGGVDARRTAIEKLAAGKDALPHILLVNEVAKVATWLNSQTPAKVIEEQMPGVTFNSNKIASTFKGDDGQQQFAKSVLAMVKAIQEYVKQHHASGVEWGTDIRPEAADANEPKITDPFALAKRHVDAFVAAANTIGGSAAAAAKDFETAFAAHQRVLDDAAGMEKPTPVKFQQMFNPISAAVTQLEKHDGKADSLEVHCKMMKDAAAAFQWLQQMKSAANTVSGASTAVAGCVNKINGAYKAKGADGEAHVALAKEMAGALKELTTYVKANHADGIAWNSGKKAIP